MKQLKEDFVLAMRLVYAKFLFLFIYLFGSDFCHLSRISSSGRYCKQC